MNTRAGLGITQNKLSYTFYEEKYDLFSLFTYGMALVSVIVFLIKVSFPHSVAKLIFPTKQRSIRAGGNHGVTTLFSEKDKPSANHRLIAYDVMCET